MPLSPNDSVDVWIKHFVKSENPKFRGKDKKKRIQMAVAAHYAAKNRVKKDAIEFNNSTDLFFEELGEYVVKSNQKVIESKVFSAIFNEEDTTATDGVSAYQVKIRYQAPMSDVFSDEYIGVRCASPEGAKTMALAVAGQKGYTNVSVMDVAIVPDSAGSGVPTRPGPQADVNVNPDSTQGVVSPSAVSPSLSNVGVYLPKNTSRAVTPGDTGHNLVG